MLTLPTTPTEDQIETVRYYNNRIKGHCRLLMAQYNATGDDRTLELVMAHMARVRISEANLKHGQIVPPNQ